MTSILDRIEVGPQQSQYSVIWLHGLGADGHDFEPIVDELDFPARNRVRFIFPHAPKRPVTVNGGYIMRAWYDIRGLKINESEDSEGIRTSARQIEALIDNEVNRGVPAQRIVLAGFSQGGAIALHTGLRHQSALAGILALSCYLPLPQHLAAERHAANQSVPIFMAHGRQDPVIPFELGAESAKRLQDDDYPLEWHAYSMEHSVIPDEIDDIAAWFSHLFP